MHWREARLLRAAAAFALFAAAAAAAAAAHERLGTAELICAQSRPMELDAPPIAHALAEVDNPCERVLRELRVRQAALVMPDRVAIPTSVDKAASEIEMHLRKAFVLLGLYRMRG